MRASLGDPFWELKAELEITVGHCSFSDHFFEMTN